MAETLPLLRLAGVGLTFGGLILLAWWLRQQHAGARARLLALVAVTAFLTFDLIVFGAFTRLSDSGLGCPDWPGCYGQASPAGAAVQIDAAAAAQPSGPVTPAKAWIEMIHRYLAMTVGVLILATLVLAWRKRGQLHLAWPVATLVWVIVQGLFGKYTVTLKLAPAVVTLHLLGGLLLLAMLVAQAELLRQRRIRLAVRWRSAVSAALAVVALQVALGAWVSSNYAVLACQGFPQCSGQWWPQMDFAQGFSVARELGRDASGAFLPVQALVAIHMAHRVFALLVFVAVGVLAARLRKTGAAGARGAALMVDLALAWQLASGLGNVLLGWPLFTALAHTAGAAALVAVLVSLRTRLA